MKSARLLGLASLAVGWPEIALAQEAQPERFGLPREAHSDEPSPALQLTAAYTAEVWHNTEGLEDGTRYLDNFDLVAEVDLEQAAGLDGARAFAYVLYNGNGSISELAGDAQAISNIETGVRALRLYEAWYERDFGSVGSVRIGLYDLNSEFDALESANLFLNGSHGIGTDISQSGENGPSIFPYTGLAVRGELAASDKLTLRAAVIDAVPGDPDHPKRTTISTDEGALYIGEADLEVGPARLLAGAWHYGEEQALLDGSGSGTSQGAYLRGETFFGGPEGDRWSLFARTGIASGQTNPFAFYLSAGVGVKPASRWHLGAAVSHARASDAFRSTEATAKAETAFEITAAYELAPGLTVQPDIQYVVNPGARDEVRNALVGGVRVTVERAFPF